jgi:PHP family Zn ribbon phosphoesterase
MTREEAIKLIDTHTVCFYNEIDSPTLQALHLAIEALQDRPKGEWIKKQVFNPELDKYVPLIECSVCGYEPYFGGSESKFNYCANCGARMEK